MHIGDTIRAEATAFLLRLAARPPAYLSGVAPDVWDINNGWCLVFAETVAERVPGAKVVDAADLGADPSVCHYVLVHNGRFYDAEAPEGMEAVCDLPIYHNRGKTRAQVVAERAAA